MEVALFNWVTLMRCVELKRESGSNVHSRAAACISRVNANSLVDVDVVVVEEDVDEDRISTSAAARPEPDGVGYGVTRGNAC